MDSKRILAKSKARTTHENLVIGIESAVSGLPPEMLSCVCMVSLSSTLATNSIVEGRFGRVALISIGKTYGGSAGADYVINISGGHGIHGGEEAPLDRKSAAEFISSVKGNVDAFAISSLMSVRNPAHELAVREMVESELDVPAVCGHELSSTLGFNVRTATCVMNAGLIPIMRSLIDAVRRMMDAHGIDGPLMVVRGNGSLMNEDTAIRYPVETIMSGPTASMVGAITMTGLKDAIVMDVGGTTTDIGVLRGGLPAVVPEGISVGNVRTHIAAARINTAGFGGDSRVFVNGNRIRLSKIRAIPLCVAAERWPEAAEHIRSLSGKRILPQRGSKADAMVDLDCEMFVSVSEYDGRVFATEPERRFMELVRDRPMSKDSAAIALGCSPREFDVDTFEKYGYIRRISVTPTDIVAAMGLYGCPCSDVSTIGVDYLAACSDRTREEFFSDNKDAVLMQIGKELLSAVMTDEYGLGDVPRMSILMLANSLGIGRRGILDSSLRFSSPIIGIGASAGIYIRWLGDALGTETIIPEDSDVGNAVGAISAPMAEVVHTLIMPAVLGSKNDLYEIYIRSSRTEVGGIYNARRLALSLSQDYLSSLLTAAGATDIEFTHESEDVFVDVPEGRILSEVRLTVRGVGRPSAFSDVRNRIMK